MNIIKLTEFKKSYELDLKTPDLLFDPIYENMVFLMKFTIIIAEKIKRFFKRKVKEQKLDTEDETTLYRVELQDNEKSTLKSLTYRVVFYISQLRNFMITAIQKNILTPKFYLLYSQVYPGEFKTLRDLQNNINGIALEQFIKLYKDQLGFVDSYFRRNAMKLLTIRQFKRVFTRDYLKDSVMLAMSYFKVTPEFRNALCEFYYFYNVLADFFYIFQTEYASVQYSNFKQQQDGNGSAVQSQKSNLSHRDFANVIRLKSRAPSQTELKTMEVSLTKKNFGMGLGKKVLDNLKLFNESSAMGDLEKKEKNEQLNKIMGNLDKMIKSNKDDKMELDQFKQSGRS